MSGFKLQRLGLVMEPEPGKKSPADLTLFICNFTPMPRPNYRVGAPVDGDWREALNSDGENGFRQDARSNEVQIKKVARVHRRQATLPACTTR